MPTLNKKLMDSIRDNLVTQNPESFLGSAFYAHLVEANESLERKTWQLEDYLDPCHVHFLNPLNPVFLYQIYSLEVIRFVKFIQVRDGAYSVANFFDRFPSPGDIKCALIMPELYQYLIPNEWENNVVYYHYRISPKLEVKASPVLYLKGICSPVSYSETHIQRLIEGIKANGIEQIYAYLPVREDYYGTKKEKDLLYDQRLVEALYRDTDAKIDFIGWKELLQVKQHGYVYDLNGAGEIIYDDFLMNKLISEGNLPLITAWREKSSEEITVRLSEFHEVVILDSDRSSVAELHSEAMNMKKILSGADAVCWSEYVYYLKELHSERLCLHKWYYSH